MCRMAGTFSCDQLMVNGKLEISTMTVLRIHGQDLLDELFLVERQWSRGRGLRGRRWARCRGACRRRRRSAYQSCAMSGPQVGSLPTTTMATSEFACGREGGLVEFGRRRS